MRPPNAPDKAEATARISLPHRLKVKEAYQRDRKCAGPAPHVDTSWRVAVSWLGRDNYEKGRSVSGFFDHFKSHLPFKEAQKESTDTKASEVLDKSAT